MDIKLRNFNPIDSDRLDNLLRSLVTHRSNYVNADHACTLMEQSLMENTVNLEVRCDARVESRLARQHLRELYLERITYIIGEIEELMIDWSKIMWDSSQQSHEPQSNCHIDGV